VIYDGIIYDNVRALAIGGDARQSREILGVHKTTVLRRLDAYGGGPGSSVFRAAAGEGLKADGCPVKWLFTRLKTLAAENRKPGSANCARTTAA